VALVNGGEPRELSSESTKLKPAPFVSCSALAAAAVVTVASATAAADVATAAAAAAVPGWTGVWAGEMPTAMTASQCRLPGRLRNWGWRGGLQHCANTTVTRLMMVSQTGTLKEKTSVYAIITASEIMVACRLEHLVRLVMISQRGEQIHHQVLSLESRWVSTLASALVQS